MSFGRFFSLTRRGMTFIEMTIVIAIAAMVTALGIYSLERVTVKRVDMQALSIISLVRKVQADALTIGADRCIRFYRDRIDVFDGDTCGDPADFLERYELKAEVRNPSPPWDLVVLTFQRAPWRPGGGVSAPFFNSGEMVLSVGLGDATRDVRLYETTGYLMME